MNKPINRDIAAFKDDFYKGLSVRECIYGGAALISGVCGILALVYIYGMNVNLAITLCLPMIGFIGLCGFYEKNGMTFWQIIKRMIALKRQKPLTYQTRMCMRHSDTKKDRRTRI